LMTSANAKMADLEKRTMILEGVLLAKRSENLSESKKTASEQAPKPTAPVKPAAPPRRMTLDEAPAGEKK
jgi:hypothetical protein